MNDPSTPTPVSTAAPSPNGSTPQGRVTQAGGEQGADRRLRVRPRPPRTRLTRPVEFGLTRLVERWAPGRLDDLRRLVDARAAIVVSPRGITYRSLLWSHTLKWDHIDEIVLSSRLDAAFHRALDFLPWFRLPGSQELAERALTGLGERVFGTQLASLRDRFGWAVDEVERTGLRRDIELKRLVGVVAFLYPELTELVTAEAERRGIPVRREA